MVLSLFNIIYNYHIIRMMIPDLIFPKCHGNQCFWNFTDTFMPLKLGLKLPLYTQLTVTAVVIYKLEPLV